MKRCKIKSKNHIKCHFPRNQKINKARNVLRRWGLTCGNKMSRPTQWLDFSPSSISNRHDQEIKENIPILGLRQSPLVLIDQKESEYQIWLEFLFNNFYYLCAIYDEANSGRTFNLALDISHPFVLPCLFKFPFLLPWNVEFWILLFVFLTCFIQELCLNFVFNW